MQGGPKSSGVMGTDRVDKQGWGGLLLIEGLLFTSPLQAPPPANNNNGRRVALPKESLRIVFFSIVCLGFSKFFLVWYLIVI